MENPMETQRHDPDVFHPGSKYYNSMDDIPPRCRSCGSEDVVFMIIRGKRYWQCNKKQCGRYSANPARYNKDTAVAPPRSCTIVTFNIAIIGIIIATISIVIYFNIFD